MSGEWQDIASAPEARGLTTGSGQFYPASHVPPRAGFLFAMAVKFKHAAGGKLSADEALHLARTTYQDLLPYCGGRHFHPDYDWSIGAAFEWADTDIELWERAA